MRDGSRGDFQLHTMARNEQGPDPSPTAASMDTGDWQCHHPVQPQDQPAHCWQSRLGQSHPTRT